jgi:uncharacterized protein YciI
VTCARPIPLPARTLMYVINLIYTASLERIDDALEAHRAFLAK